MAFSVVTASFAETVKSAEPITSVVLAYVILKEVESVPTYMCLIPVCAGVACSCLHDDSFNTFGFVCAALSNVCFSGRAVYAKKLMNSFPGLFNEIELFSYISIIGLGMLIPVALYMEGYKLYTNLFLPIVGKLFSKDKVAYSYLSESANSFPSLQLHHFQIPQSKFRRLCMVRLH